MLKTIDNFPSASWYLVVSCPDAGFVAAKLPTRPDNSQLRKGSSPKKTLRSGRNCGKDKGNKKMKSEKKSKGSLAHVFVKAGSA